MAIIMPKLMDFSITSSKSRVMDQVARLSSATCSYLTAKLDIRNSSQQLLAYVPITDMDPGIVYLIWLRSCGVTLGNWAINYARYLRKEPLSEAMYKEPQERVRYLNRLELERKNFEHYTKPESVDSCETLSLAAKSSTITSLESGLMVDRGENGACELGSPTSNSAIKAQANGVLDQQLDDKDDWLLVVPLETSKEIPEAALDEVDAHTGGIGMAM